MKWKNKKGMVVSQNYYFLSLSKGLPVKSVTSSDSAGFIPLTVKLKTECAHSKLHWGWHGHSLVIHYQYL